MKWTMTLGIQPGPRCDPRAYEGGGELILYQLIILGPSLSTITTYRPYSLLKPFPQLD